LHVKRTAPPVTLRVLVMKNYFSKDQNENITPKQGSSQKIQKTAQPTTHMASPARFPTLPLASVSLGQTATRDGDLRPPSPQVSEAPQSTHFPNPRSLPPPRRPLAFGLLRPGKHPPAHARRRAAAAAEVCTSTFRLFYGLLGWRMIRGHVGERRARVNDPIL
jgi:hypothetical protein